jgi:hypothetical protein
MLRPVAATIGLEVKDMRDPVIGSYCESLWLRSDDTGQSTACFKWTFEGSNDADLAVVVFTVAGPMNCRNQIKKQLVLLKQSLP